MKYRIPLLLTILDLQCSSIGIPSTVYYHGNIKPISFNYIRLKLRVIQETTVAQSITVFFTYTNFVVVVTLQCEVVQGINRQKEIRTVYNTNGSSSPPAIRLLSKRTLTLHFLSIYCACVYPFVVIQKILYVL